MNIKQKSLLVIAGSIIALFILALASHTHAASWETAEITVCDTRCEATEYVLWKYLEGYDGETAPILQIPHDGAWWAEFNETIYYLTDLREKGEI